MHTYKELYDMYIWYIYMIHIYDTHIYIYCRYDQWPFTTAQRQVLQSVEKAPKDGDKESRKSRGADRGWTQDDQDDRRRWGRWVLTTFQWDFLLGNVCKTINHQYFDGL